MSMYTTITLCIIQNTRLGRETAESFSIKFITSNETDILIHIINNVIIIYLCNVFRNNLFHHHVIE